MKKLLLIFILFISIFPLFSCITMKSYKKEVDYNDFIVEYNNYFQELSDKKIKKDFIVEKNRIEKSNGKINEEEYIFFEHDYDLVVAKYKEKVNEYIYNYLIVDHKSQGLQYVYFWTGNEGNIGRSFYLGTQYEYAFNYIMTDFSEIFFEGGNYYIDKEFGKTIFTYKFSDTSVNRVSQFIFSDKFISIKKVENNEFSYVETNLKVTYQKVDLANMLNMAF